jgi:hypothetical protein
MWKMSAALQCCVIVDTDIALVETSTTIITGLDMRQEEDHPGVSQSII